MGQGTMPRWELNEPLTRRERHLQMIVSLCRLFLAGNQVDLPDFAIKRDDMFSDQTNLYVTAKPAKWLAPHTPERLGAARI